MAAADLGATTQLLPCHTAPSTNCHCFAPCTPRWDLAILKLTDTLQCSIASPAWIKKPQRCQMAVAALTGGEFTGRFRVAGYGKPSLSTKPDAKQLMRSNTCEAKLATDLGYGYSTCESTLYMSGAPFFMFGPVAGPDPTLSSLAKGTKHSAFAAVGLHHAVRVLQPTQHESAAELLFTPAHLTWLYYAGVKGALMYTCGPGKGGKPKACVTFRPK